MRGVTVEPGGSVTVPSGEPPCTGRDTRRPGADVGQPGVPVQRVTVLHGNTDECPRGIGTFGSRSAPAGAAAIFNNAETVRERAKALAARLLRAATEDISFEDGRFFVAGSPARAVGLSEIAAFAYSAEAPEGAAAESTTDVEFEPRGETLPFGTHLCAVEIDPDTGAVEILRYISVDDCGRVITPLLAEGQVHGGLAQGIAQALYEDAVYDEGGNLLTPTFLEYAVPRADMLPKYELHRTVTPTPENPLGVKGIGEAATIGSTPAVCNAVMDALRPFGVEHLDTPLTPEKVWRAMQGGGSDGAVIAPPAGNTTSDRHFRLKMIRNKCRIAPTLPLRSACPVSRISLSFATSRSFVMATPCCAATRSRPPASVFRPASRVRLLRGSLRAADPDSSCGEQTLR